MKFGHHALKGSVDLPNGVTLGFTVTGDIVSIDKDGKRTTLHNADALRTFWYDVSNTWPEAPKIPYDPALAAQVKAAQAAVEASKPHNVTATRDADGSIRLTLEDGTTATLPSA